MKDNINISIDPGKYVVAVSGGVDSVSLLHMLYPLPGIGLTVAHFDHGIRADSDKDRLFVADLARRYGLLFVHARGNLGVSASEAQARHARYGFLYKVQAAAGASGLITAHHQDDVLETAILNILRGTGRHGIASLRSTGRVVRPLLHVTKSDILTYARNHELVWREDTTNAQDIYKRNYVRRHILPRFISDDRQKLYDHITNMQNLNQELDMELDTLLNSLITNEKLDRTKFIMLPHNISREIALTWLRRYGISDIDRPMIERFVHAAKTGMKGNKVNIKHKYYLSIQKHDLALELHER